MPNILDCIRLRLTTTHNSIMRSLSLLTPLCLSVGALAGAVIPAVDVEVRNAPGKSVSETLWALRRHLNDVRLHQRDDIFSMNTTEIEAGFSNVVLLKV